MRLPHLPLSEKGIEYTLLDKISSGSYGEVYRAIDPYIAMVAIKFPRGDSEEQLRDSREVLRDEARIMGHISSPYFTALVDQGRQAHPFLVMEYVPHTISQMIGDHQINQEVIINYLRQMPQALRELQRQGVAHCDLKPNNVGYSGKTVKILDFGSAILSRGTEFKSITELNDYHPPELDICLVTPTTDTFMAGRTLEVMLSGEINTALSETFLAIESRWMQKLPLEVRSLLRGMLHRDHSRRAKPEELSRLAEEAIKVILRRNTFQREPDLYIAQN